MAPWLLLAAVIAWAEDDSVFDLPGPDLHVAGRFTQVHTNWPESALLYQECLDLWVLDGGASEPRRVRPLETNFSCIPAQFAWQPDGDALYGWFAPPDGLVAMHVSTGASRTLAIEPTRRYAACASMYDPAPVPRRRGMILSGRTLFVLLQQTIEGDEPVHWLASLHVDAPSPALRRAGEPRTGEALSWDLSLDRSELYVLTKTEGRTCVRVFDATLLREHDVPTAAGVIELSPDERRMLIGPAPALATHETPLVLLDLDTGASATGPPGWGAAWRPDGRSIAYLGKNALWLWEVESGFTRRLVGREPLVNRFSYYEPPVWSADGARLAVNPGSGSDDLSVLLDLERSEVFLLPVGTSNACWAPVARPFIAAR